MSAPTALSSFIDREIELEEISALLLKSRLVTLTGAGGTGKTRLAQRVVATLPESFGDDVAFIELAHIRDPALVLSAIGEGVGIHDAGYRQLTITLRECLRTRRLLLVLDNCEHVLAAAPTIGGLLAEAPYLRILATSREPLRLQGEHVYPVMPLRTPDLNPSASAHVLAESPSVKLPSVSTFGEADRDLKTPGKGA